VIDLDAKVRQDFAASNLPHELVDELIESFAESKRRFYRDDLRPSEIEGARFSEAVFRILEWATTGVYTPLGKTMPKVDTLLNTLANQQNASDSLRLHIPRTLRLIYDIRNKRDVAHLGDGIDPNVQDASLVVHNMEWVLAELVRLFHKVSAADAQAVITELVSKEVPLIQVIDGFPRLLSKLTASDHILVLLYWRGVAGATYPELFDWVRAPMRSNLKRTIRALDSKDLVHQSSDRYVLTKLGETDVESRRLLEPA
jgi:hypothetical protein